MLGIWFLLLFLLTLGYVAFFVRGSEVCPACLAIEPYEGHNYFQCHECGYSWVKYNK